MVKREELEVWENRNRSEIWVEVEDVSGRPVSRRVGPGQRIELSSYDRQLNQEAARNGAGPDYDWFTNGALSNVRLLDTADDYEEIKSNVNTKSEAEIRDLLKLNANELKKELAEITSPLVVARLKNFIESDDADKAESITVAKVKAVNARYDELHPQVTGKVFDTYEEAIAKPQKLR
jgi:hypothetical protein